LNIGIAGCVLTGLDATIFQELVKSKFDMFIHMGDLHSSDIGLDDPKLFGDELTWCMALARSGGVATVVLHVGCHDYVANMLSVGRSAALTSFKEYEPHPSRARVVPPPQFGLPCDSRGQV